MKGFLLFLILVLFSSCGYTPSSKFSRQVTGKQISTSVVISALNPENTVIIKDAIDSAIIDVFHATLTSRARSKTHLVMSISTPSNTPIVFDKDGYVIGYRMAVQLNITRYSDGISKKYKTKGTHDFNVAPNAIVTDYERFEAIRFSSAKAIHSFIAQVSAEGAKINNKENSDTE